MQNSSISILSLTVMAAGAISAGRAVGFDGAQATTLGQKVLGIARNDEVSGRHVSVMAKGVAIVEAAEAIAAGDELTVDADGNAIKPTLDAHHRFADALTSATAAGDKIEVLLR